MHVALRGAEHPVPGFADPQHVARAAGVAQPGESPEPGSRPSRRGCPARGQPGYAFGTSCSREAPVVVGPGDERAAGAGGRGYSYVRASHADREQVIDVLKAAFVQGRLAKDELDLRLGRVLASRTYADLSALTADLPVRLTRAQPPEPVRQPGSQKPGIDQPGSQKPGIDQPGTEQPGIDQPGSEPVPVSSGRKIIRAWACATVVLPSLAVGVALLNSGTDIAMIAIAVALFACVVAVPVSGLMMLHSWLEKTLRQPGG